MTSFHQNLPIVLLLADLVLVRMDVTSATDVVKTVIVVRTVLVTLTVLITETTSVVVVVEAACLASL